MRGDTDTPQLFHNWNSDPYAKGIWVMFRTKQAERTLPVMRQSVDNIHFANSDWAHGWRGFIEGAIEQGLHAGVKIQKLLGSEDVNGSVNGSVNGTH